MLVNGEGKASAGKRGERLVAERFGVEPADPAFVDRTARFGLPFPPPVIDRPAQIALGDLRTEREEVKRERFFLAENGDRRAERFCPKLLRDLQERSGQIGGEKLDVRNRRGEDRDGAKERIDIKSILLEKPAVEVGLRLLRGEESRAAREFKFDQQFGRFPLQLNQVGRPQMGISSQTPSIGNSKRVRLSPRWSEASISSRVTGVAPSSSRAWPSAPCSIAGEVGSTSGNCIARSTFFSQYRCCERVETIRISC